MLGRNQTGNSKLVKQMNRQEILRKLRENKRVSRADLAKLTELSRPCVSALVDEMMKEGLIHEVGVGESKGGRKPILLEYNFQAYGVVGAIFEGSTLYMSIADLSGDLLVDYNFRLQQPTNGDMAIRCLELGLQTLLSKSGFEKSRLLGVGLGLPGITQRRDGTVSYAPSTGWMGLPVKQEIEERLGLPVVIDNDVNLMTLGEFHKGVGYGVKNQVYMYVGTGIGAGIILDGQFYRGSREASGEIGYMMVGQAKKLNRGEYGVFEGNYSVPVIQDKARKVLPSFVEELGVIKQLIRHTEDGHIEAGRLLNDIYRHWAYGIANMVSILDPDLLIFSGAMIDIEESGVEKIQGMLTGWVPYVPQIKLAALGYKAGIIGAIHSVLEAFPIVNSNKIYLSGGYVNENK
ncbi:ROK family transcriptional regulator [Paenibacillus andongensis]|uniref:ROK family transcriptional regulator n=1 Tax=Paenibacillus andongensis TaxID=2975482 RepID=UPI0021BAC6F2|nr:ROK family transcriptional regulator [Paenibacillus andongensis]